MYMLRFSLGNASSRPKRSSMVGLTNFWKNSVVPLEEGPDVFFRIDWIQAVLEDDNEGLFSASDN